MPNSSIIEVEELFQIFNDQNVRIFDVSNHKNAYTNFLNAHLKGAQFVDLNRHLAVVPEYAKNGGRHPLPDIEKFAFTLTQLGIENDSRVIIYDDTSGANAAARFWWMLKSLGHQSVKVLNGGIQAAMAKKFPLQSGHTTFSSTNKIYNTPSKWQLPLVNLNFVEKAIDNNEYKIIDVRSSERYAGYVEPLDTVAGHIPTAINIPYSENLTEEGFFKKPEILKSLYKKHWGNFQSQSIILHCGSGVTACHTLLALDYAGIEIPNLYVGSWSEWSSNQMPIEKSI